MRHLLICSAFPFLVVWASALTNQVAGAAEIGVNSTEVRQLGQKGKGGNGNKRGQQKRQGTNSNGNGNGNSNSNNARPWVKYKLDPKKYPLATCLDGSPGMYYVRKGAQPAKVYVHLQGSSMCSTGAGPNSKCQQDCLSMSKTGAGSTLPDRGKPFQQSSGLLSPSKVKNPALADWTHVSTCM
jgi:hypothetical protein